MIVGIFVVLFFSIGGFISCLIIEDIKSFRKCDENIRPEIAMIADLIKIDRDWVKDEYVWFHPSGVSLWVGNRQIGLSVRWGTKGRNEYHALSDAGKWRLTMPEYNLVIAAMGREGVKPIDKSVAAVAQRITEMYGEKNA